MADFVQKDGSENGEERADVQSPPKEIKERKLSWARLRRVDSLDFEAGRVSGATGHGSRKGWLTALNLALQSIGVVYGDIGTSPLYVYSSTFTRGIDDQEDILGVLSLIIYTIVLITFIKYVFIVLFANDNGDGGTFALYTLICKHAPKVGLIPNIQQEDREISNYKLDKPSSHLRRAQKVKEFLEKNKAAKTTLFLVTMIGTSMVIGDGILTPCISVLSAVGGIKTAASSLNQDAVVAISAVILILLFAVQKYGTDKVGYAFAPIVLIWFSFIGITGIYNLFKYDVGVLHAFNPQYIVKYFKRTGKQGWISLGGVLLCITGPIYWPTFVVANAAAIIASQAMISGAFAVIAQCLPLGCFPRVKVIHTSAKYEGQVYIPELNYFLMAACVIVTVAFRTTNNIGNAYGIAVIAVMVKTTFVVTVIMLMIWKISIWLVALFFVVFGVVELVYLSSALYKFKQGGYLPLAFSLAFTMIMITWHYVHKKRYQFELENKVSDEYMSSLANNPNLIRIPGMGLLYSELVHGIPPIFSHFISSIPSIHSVLIFVTIKSIPVSKVALEERFLFRQVEPKEYRMFRCVVRYGYNDVMDEPKVFQSLLVEYLKEFVRQQDFFLETETTDQSNANQEAKESKQRASGSSTVYDERCLQQSSGPIQAVTSARSRNSSSQIISGPIQAPQEEAQFLQKALDDGVVYLLGEAEVTAKAGSSLLKKFAVNYAYKFIRKNLRDGEKVMGVPRSRMLRVGMTYEI
ncbi:potassium transporter 5 isoform X2 [Amborella trichopoda]|uniref:potassium transporter 5 isoform X2 n=1 Tax=Amborella trichopoda TaxID=13333 RepID=UPI0009C1A77B|nr:potassium transporter 5 isoform X2 [Amborella trichopoda]|eukprot:XP_020522976.1 potassium transporter 5 isoform X2 [Amborella trichopoda]